MINYRIIARVFSILLIFEGLMMLLSALVSYLYLETTTSSLLYSAFITILAGIIAFVPLHEDEKVYGNREGYIIVLLLSTSSTQRLKASVIRKPAPYINSNNARYLGDRAACSKRNTSLPLRTTGGGVRTRTRRTRWNTFGRRRVSE